MKKLYLPILTVLLALTISVMPLHAELSDAFFGETKADILALQGQEPEEPEEPEEAEEEEEEEGIEDVEDLDDLDEFFNDDDFFSDEGSELEMLFNLGGQYEMTRIPTIELFAGMTTPSLNEEFHTGTYASVGDLNARFGFSKIGKRIHDTPAAKYGFSFLSINTSSYDYMEGGDNTFSDMRVNGWRIGLGSQEGYGWRIGESSMITLYHGGEMNWGKMNFVDEFADSMNTVTAAVFTEDVHYGENVTSGIKIKMGRYVSLNGEYEIQHTYPRFKTYKWFLSKIIQGAAGGVAGLFTDEIKDRVPTIVPVIDFVLQSAINYGYYELSKDQMVWPFDSAPPLRHESFRVGLTFTF